MTTLLNNPRHEVGGAIFDIPVKSLDKICGFGFISFIVLGTKIIK